MCTQPLYTYREVTATVPSYRSSSMYFYSTSALNNVVVSKYAAQKVLKINTLVWTFCIKKKSLKIKEDKVQKVHTCWHITLMRLVVVALKLRPYDSFGL